MSSFMDDIRERAINKLRPPHNSLNNVISITPVGTRALEQDTVPEHQWRVLNQLSESGAITVRQLARELGISENSADATCKAMFQARLIKKSGGDIE